MQGGVNKFTFCVAKKGIQLKLNMAMARHRKAQKTPATFPRSKGRRTSGLRLALDAVHLLLELLVLGALFAPQLARLFLEANALAELRIERRRLVVAADVIYFGTTSLLRCRHRCHSRYCRLHRHRCDSIHS